MKQPKVNILVHATAGKLVRIKDVVHALRVFRENLLATKTDNPLYRRGETEMLNRIIVEIEKWETKKP